MVRFMGERGPLHQLVDNLGLRRLMALDLDRFVDGEIGIAARRPDPGARLTPGVRAAS